jgi:hypothetical protein
MWENDKLTSYVTDINNLVASENATPEDVMALTRKVDLHIKTLEYLKKKPSWQNPDLEPNAEFRKKIILARENENYLIGIKRAINLGYEYKSLEDQAEKQKKKTELDTCLANLKVVNNEYVALARMNSMKEVEKPQEKDYSRQNYEEALIEFNRLDHKQLKFSSYEDVIKNYHHNMAMCYKAQMFENMLGEAILRGKSDFTDKFLMETRAKLALFHEVKRTSTYLNLILCKNPDAMNDPDNEDNPNSLFNLLVDAINTHRNYIEPVLPGEDLSDYYKRTYATIKQDHNNREETINTAYYGICNRDVEEVEYNVLEPGQEAYGQFEYPTPSRQEMSQRKKDYQKNQTLHEFLFRILQSFNQEIDENVAAVTTYCKRNGMKMPNMERIQSFSGLKPQQAIDLYKKYVGSSQDKIDFYKAQLKEINDMDIEQYQMSDPAKVYKGVGLKKRYKVALLATSAQSFAEKIVNLTEEGEDIPNVLGTTDRQEFIKKAKLLQNFYCAYPGKMVAFSQMGASKYRGAVSLDDYKKMDPKLLQRKISSIIYNEKDVDCGENINQAMTLYIRYNADSEPQPVYSKLDMDMKFLYREEYKKVYGKYPDANA